VVGNIGVDRTGAVTINTRATRTKSADGHREWYSRI
jgi:hypothetical protein